MPRLVAVIGGENSGRMAVIQHLTKELKNRGYRVGLVKEFTGGRIDDQIWDAGRYDGSGLEAVVIAAIKDTAFFIGRRMGLGEIISSLHGLDYVLLEGFKEEKTVIKVVAAKDVDEAMLLIDDLTIAISGQIAESMEGVNRILALKIPVINCKVEAGKLGDLIESKALPYLPGMGHCGECGYKSCYEFAKATVKSDRILKECPILARDDVILEVNGGRVPLKDFPSNIIRNVIIGIALSLKNVGDVEEVKVTVRRRP